MMTESDLKQQCGPKLWAEFSEEEKEVLRGFYRIGGNHRGPPDQAEQARRERILASIEAKKASHRRRQGNGQASGSTYR